MNIPMSKSYQNNKLDYTTEAMLHAQSLGYFTLQKKHGFLVNWILFSIVCIWVIIALTPVSFRNTNVVQHGGNRHIQTSWTECRFYANDRIVGKFLFHSPLINKLVELLCISEYFQLSSSFFIDIAINYTNLYVSLQAARKLHAGWS